MRPVNRIAASAWRPRPLSECPECGSRYVHACTTRSLPGGFAWATLYCPECRAHRDGRFSLQRLRELDRVVAAGRAELRTLYERLVRDNMYRELESLRECLARDLVGADDFAP